MDKVFFGLSLVGWTSAGGAWFIREVLGYSPEPPRGPDWDYSDEFLVQYLRSERWSSQYYLSQASGWWGIMDDRQRTQAKQKYQRLNEEPLLLSNRFLEYHRRNYPTEHQ
jgi:hypothetical protein